MIDIIGAAGPFVGSDPSNTNTSGGIPDCIADGNYSPSNRMPTNWFNAAAFAVPPAGRLGNCGGADHLGASRAMQFRLRINF